ncbi:Holliday junction branch migration protein RuvA [Merismopedia glauca]|uniref:Holliday junction branch migration complex subunit RuvA n=1 Tax=Merismopedia glauca CCAP 1448/3 TaxID=1296344 RepID=A0A2T1C157_9CYAN|nr:Holliday junction branch migration protein RuvA [Merismopedia glauca]PSB01999.1 Holliday junction branch migration protein RuvA [Merismopedia glauca CCAP 1448/3]
MIGYLKGNVVEIDRRINNRTLLILEVNQIGYEIQVPNRLTKQIIEENQILQVFTHVQTKEEQTVLFGFGSKAERDLFRQLISVSGVGAQLAIALLDTLEVTDLVQAIVSGNIRLLTKAPGVGNKIAERMTLELKTKLKQWRVTLGLSETPSSVVTVAIQEDVEITLLALGYTNLEIAEALQALSQDPQLAANPQPEEWIKRAITWLSL